MSDVSRNPRKMVSSKIGANTPAFRGRVGNSKRLSAVSTGGIAVFGKAQCGGQSCGDMGRGGSDRRASTQRIWVFSHVYLHQLAWKVCCKPTPDAGRV